MTLHVYNHYNAVSWLSLKREKSQKKKSIQYLPSPNAFPPESPLNPSKCSEIIPAPFFPKEMKGRARIFHIMMPSSGAAFSFLVFVSKSLKFNFLFRISIPLLFARALRTGTHLLLWCSSNSVFFLLPFTKLVWLFALIYFRYAHAELCKRMPCLYSGFSFEVMSA